MGKVFEFFAGLFLLLAASVATIAPHHRPSVMVPYMLRRELNKAPEQ